MEKQNSKKDTDLPINHYITVNFRCSFNFASTAHETCPLCCAQMKAQVLEPLNITFLPKICLNKPVHTITDFDTIGTVTKEIKIYADVTINVRMLWVAGKIYWNNQK